jgi:multicomponent Na+:H+ antiporter subunit G
MTVAAVILIVSGIFFLTVGSIGVIRLPDFYSRSHAMGKADTLGLLLCLIGLALYNGFAFSSVKLILIAVFVALANPVASHALARAAFRRGIIPWFKGGEK